MAKSTILRNLLGKCGFVQKGSCMRAPKSAETIQDSHLLLGSNHWLWIVQTPDHTMHNFGSQYGVPYSSCNWLLKINLYRPYISHIILINSFLLEFLMLLNPNSIHFNPHIFGISRLQMFFFFGATPCLRTLPLLPSLRPRVLHARVMKCRHCSGTRRVRARWWMRWKNWCRCGWDVLRCVEMCWDVLRCVELCWAGFPGGETRRNCNKANSKGTGV